MPSLREVNALRQYQRATQLVGDDEQSPPPALVSTILMNNQWSMKNMLQSFQLDSRPVVLCCAVQYHSVNLADHDRPNQQDPHSLVRQKQVETDLRNW